jgi:adenosylcobinamide-phosphate synthase
MGALLGWFEARLNTGGNRRARGVAALLLLLGTVLAASLLVTDVTRLIPFGWAIDAVLASSLIAQVALGRAVKAVADGLGISLQQGRDAVRHIVGRDPDVLDEAGVARAAIESLAESLSDGVVAPLFWLTVAGLPGIALYKAVNTADSMIGHRTERYREFGWASARLDDLLNWIPARLTAVLVAAAALLARRADAEQALAVARRDARRHDSPNAGWPEAAFAGALGLGLGGPRSYGGQMHDLPTFGDGRRDLGALDIYDALALYWMTLNVTLALSVALALLLWPLA